MNRRVLAAASRLLASRTLPVAAAAGAVRVGSGVGLKGLETAGAAGFDVVELRTTEIAALSAADIVVQGISVEASSKDIPTEGPARLRRCVAP
jgi:hypothetical protein